MFDVPTHSDFWGPSLQTNGSIEYPIIVRFHRVFPAFTENCFSNYRIGMMGELCEENFDGANLYELVISLTNLKHQGGIGIVDG